MQQTLSIYKTDQPGSFLENPPSSSNQRPSEYAIYDPKPTEDTFPLHQV